MSPSTDSQSLSIQFLGAAQTVTGSKYLIRFRGKKILVDCGLFQGMKDLRLKNWNPFPVEPASIDAVVLTHAHIDHSGYIPRLIKEGFRGRVICTPATLALSRLLLPDTGYLLEEEAEFLNRKKLSKHQPALPLFSREEAEQALRFFRPLNYHEDLELCPDLHIRFFNAGHILGAASLLLNAGGRTVAFSGDVGRLNDPVMKAPEPLPAFDYLVVESTYGDRVHGRTDPTEELASIINRTAQRGGVVMIPAFAVGRAQSLLHFLAELKLQKRIPEIPMYLNSPMAAGATETFYDFPSLHKLDRRACEEMRDAFRYVKNAEDSKLLNTKSGPMVIISASGMISGGRILHHIKQFAPDPKASIVLAGFQAAGTRGRALLDGVRELKIHGQYVSVQSEVYSLENLSAHADYTEILEWLSKSPSKPRKVFVTHGEPEAANHLGLKINEKLGWDFAVPKHEDIFTLE